MEVNTAQSGVGNGGEQIQSAAEKVGMGKTQFLQLLTAQLQHQDPLNPMDDQQFVAQLAQFSQLEQSISMNEKLEVLKMHQASMVSSQSMSLIGKEIVASGDRVVVGANQDTVGIQYRLDDSADSVMVQITDEYGQAVRTINLGSAAQGSHTTEWDRRDNWGNRVPDGTYKIAVHAKKESGATVSTQTRTEGRVTSVSFENGYAELILGSIRVQPADVSEVREAATDSNDDETNDESSAVGADDTDSDEE